MRTLLSTIILLMLAASAAAQTADRLYVLDCGHNSAPDQSRWSPGVNVGKPIEQSNTCALIRHGTQWLLWDTGYQDAIVDRPVDTPVGHATRARKLAAELAEVGVQPPDITFVAVSHTHPDHVGNVELFPAATLLIQKAEVDWAFAAGKPAPFRKDRPMKLLDGDLDVFGDGSVPSPVDARSHAGSPVAAGASRQDGLDRADRRRGTFQGQLGQRSRALDEHQRRADPRFACPARQNRRREEGGALDQPRPGDLREPQALSAILRLSHRNDVMRMIDQTSNDGISPAEEASLRAPIPTQIVSSDEYVPAPQTAQQREVEARLTEIGTALARRQGISRRRFFATAAGMAASYQVMNQVYGELFAVHPAEAADPEMAQARAQSLKDQLIFDDHVHFLRDDSAPAVGDVNRIGGLMWQRAQATKFGWNKDLVAREPTLADLKYDNFFKEIYLDSDTKMALLTNAPSDAASDWILPQDAVFAARDKVNREAGSKRLLAHYTLTPSQPGWL